ncbi:MAG: hypothetical protein ACRDD1_15610, partial [Planctomycetia bacterium]
MDKLLEGMLGYLNFSDGTPSAAFQRSVSDYYRRSAGVDAPWLSLRADLETALHAASAAGTPTFRDCTQAEAVLRRTFNDVLPAYRKHHRDLLPQASDADLYQPYFMARVLEAGLAKREAPDERFAATVVDRLDDFLGHRPVAALEHAGSLQPYRHERVRPIPVFLRDAGVAFGRYEAVLSRTLGILRQAPGDLVRGVHFDPSKLDELALDPRSYDHSHPVDRRPGYNFGEWDPDTIDQRGFYRRFVLRTWILDGLEQWIGGHAEQPPEETEFEAAAVLAGTMLLASGVSGAGPGAHGSDLNLGLLVPKVARTRDQFYEWLLSTTAGPHGDRLRAEKAARAQAFAGVRQGLNQFLAQRRARQLQQDHLARLYARMGYPDAGRRQIDRIATPGVRLRCEMQIHLTAAERLVDRPAEVRDAAAVAELDAAEDLLHRAIECGAFVDPWNILGFQGQYSLFPAVENSVVDPRVPELLDLVDDLFDKFARVLREAAAAGDEAVRRRVEKQFEQLVDWWDKHATMEVSDVKRVSGRDRLHSAQFVARVLAAWRASGETTGNLAFWKLHAAEFTTPQAFHLVVDALLARGDAVAAASLLMLWLNHADQAPLDDAEPSFYAHVEQWMASVLTPCRRLDGGEAPAAPGDDAQRLQWIGKLFDLLEANAEDHWVVPRLQGDDAPTEQVEGATDAVGDEDDDEGNFSAAYEGVTYRDSTADGVEGSTLSGPPVGGAAEDDPLAELAETIGRRLRFLSMIARLWQLVATAPWNLAVPEHRDRVESWAKRARDDAHKLRRLLDGLHLHRGEPAGASPEAMAEFQRRSAVHQDLANRAMGAAVDMSHAALALAAAAGFADPVGGEPSSESLADWETRAVLVERSLRAGDREHAPRRLARVLEALAEKTTLYVPLEKGGHPRGIADARYVRDHLRRLSVQLPRLGLYRETFHLLRSSLHGENRHAGSRGGDVRQVTEFNLLFHVGFKAVVESLTASAALWPLDLQDDRRLSSLVGGLVGRFSKLWTEYTDNVQLSELERRGTPAAWDATVAFIKSYGRELFTQSFLSPANLRGIVQRGASGYVGYLLDQADDEDRRPIWKPKEAADAEPSAPKLAADVRQRVVEKSDAVEHIEFIVRIVLENYDLYKDYNATTSQSDYGDNLNILLEFARLKAQYERHWWALQPAYVAHNVLARGGRRNSAVLLENAFAGETARLADGYLETLESLHAKFGL